MSTFDDYCADLIEQAKRFLEKSEESSTNSDAERAYLNSSLLLSISALEAYINGISEEMLHIKELDILERSILSEKQYCFDKGKFKITNTLKIYRTVERIEFIYTKFGGEKIDPQKENWWPELKESIKLRNDIVHPKTLITLTNANVKKCILSVIACINALCKVV